MKLAHLFSLAGLGRRIGLEGLEAYRASTHWQRRKGRLQAKQKPCFLKYCFISSCQASMTPIRSESSRL